MSPVDYKQRVGPDGHRVHWTLWSAFQVFPMVFTLGAGILLSTIAVLLIPGLSNEGASVHRVLPHLIGILWTVCYAFGGALMVAGLTRLSPRLEAAGLYLLSATQTVNVTALIADREWHEIFLSVTLAAALAGAAAARATVLLIVFPERRRKMRQHYHGE